MERTHWHERWETGRTGWHKDGINEYLQEHLPRLTGGKPGRILVPLCGRTLDLQYLADEGHQVVGIELVELAARGFFEERGLPMRETREGPILRMESGPITILQGDYFDATAEHVGALDAVWDRASIIALPPGLRAAYAGRLLEWLEPGARSLVVTLFYDQSLLDGPPFSVPDEEIERHFGAAGELERVAHKALAGASPRFQEAGVSEVGESAWLLTRR